MDGAAATEKQQLQQRISVPCPTQSYLVLQLMQHIQLPQIQKRSTAARLGQCAVSKVSEPRLWLLQNSVTLFIISPIVLTLAPLLLLLLFPALARPTTITTTTTPHYTSHPSSQTHTMPHFPLGLPVCARFHNLCWQCVGISP